ESRIAERRVKEALIDISRKYSLQIDLLTITLPEIVENFHPLVKVNEDRAVELPCLDACLEELLLSQMAEAGKSAHSTPSFELQSMEA
ncbi:MAG: hypothetical protein QXD85_04500, partial [Fervidicoccaceae archaeon]